MRTLNDCPSCVQPSGAPINISDRKLNDLEAETLSKGRRRAFSEVSAALVHQLNEPLTALLLYLGEMKQEGEQSAGQAATPSPMREMVEKALHEAQRVCDIVERVGTRFGAPVDCETAITSGREIINWSKQSTTANSSGHTVSASPRRQHHLTPREREVLDQITGGASNKQGGRRLGISTRTFEAHRFHIMQKLEARNTADLVRMAYGNAG
jgi:DNA-binding CsgD family transcriptional regulator